MKGGDLRVVQFLGALLGADTASWALTVSFSNRMDDVSDPITQMGDQNPRSQGIDYARLKSCRCRHRLEASANVGWAGIYLQIWQLHYRQPKADAGDLLTSAACLLHCLGDWLLTHSHNLVTAPDGSHFCR